MAIVRADMTLMTHVNAYMSILLVSMHIQTGVDKTGAGNGHLRLWRADEQVPQPHGPEQAIRSRQIGVRLDDKGVALHEGPQIYHRVQFCRA